ncbi:sigma factor-like helix-turn-helix DNA-binding protein [Azovibrio restrictus]|uniref:sigma factor-like helix-turn-helix DNA-binding protein n=1 Tax=Azovibrio restrictus TaxID=146938 RepID=UPI0026F0C505|nr:sigma factor-like helix-turn-helix DNA-binding protein [Azovibrio restrictus]
MKTGRGPKAATSATSIKQAERRAEVLRLRLDGLTLSQIGDRLGIRADSVHDIITRALRSMTKEPAEELLNLELARLDSLYAEAMNSVRAFTPVLHNGRVVQIPVIDGNGQTVKDPGTGQPLTCIAQDRQPVLAGIACAVRLLERRAKLLGLDAPVRTQAQLTVTDTDTEDLSGLSLEELKQYHALLEKVTRPALPAPKENEQ